MKKPFRYYLSHPSTGTKEIEIGPDMSDELSLIFGRDTTYHGIQRTVGINVKFIKDGYDYIKTVYETFGIEAEIVFAVHELNKQINDYQTFYEGRINLSTYKIDSIFVTVSIEEGGIVSKFKSRDEIPVNLQNLISLGDVAIPPFTNETIDLSLHSKTISKKFEGSTGEDLVYVEEFLHSVNIDQPQPPPPLIPLNGTTREADWTGYCSIGFLPKVSELSEMSPYGTIITLEEPAPFYQVKEPGQHKFDFDLTYILRFGGFGGDNVKLKNCGYEDGLFDTIDLDIYFKITRGGVEYEKLSLKHYHGDGCGLDELICQETNFSLSITRDLLLDDEISVFTEHHTSGLYFRQPTVGFVLGKLEATFNQAKLTITALTQSPISASTAKSLMIFEAGARICQAITDKQDAFRSSFLGRIDSLPFSYTEDGEGAMLALTNGFQIRQFPLDQKPIYASFKDWFAALDALYNLGVGIEDDKVVVEQKKYFYNDSVIFTLDNVAELTKSVALEYYYNEFENGYGKWENEEVNGLDEFNSKRLWALPLIVNKKRLSKLAPYIGSGYALEFTRRKTYESTSTEDWKYDNDNFLVSVVRTSSGFAAKKIEGYDPTTFANILDPATAYNLDISPKRSFKYWGYILNAGLRHQQSKKIKFSFGEANYLAESKQLEEASIVVENQDSLVSTLESPLWIPEYYEFEAPINKGNIDALKSNPYGVIRFSENSTDYKNGYVINVKVDIENKKGTFKLLRANV